jgi:hypothetical protein
MQAIQKTKWIIIGIMFAIQVLFGFVDSKIDYTHPPTLFLQIISMLILIFIWYQFDLKYRKLKQQAWITFLVGMVTPVGIIAYFFYNNKIKQALFNCLKAIILYALLMLTYWLCLLSNLKLKLI